MLRRSSASAISILKTNARSAYGVIFPDLEKSNSKKEEEPIKVDPIVKEKVRQVCYSQLPSVLFTGQYWPTSLLQDIPKEIPRIRNAPYSSKE